MWPPGSSASSCRRPRVVRAMPVVGAASDNTAPSVSRTPSPAHPVRPNRHEFCFVHLSVSVHDGAGVFVWFCVCVYVLVLFIVVCARVCLQCTCQCASVCVCECTDMCAHVCTVRACVLMCASLGGFVCVVYVCALRASMSVCVRLCVCARGLCVFVFFV